MHQAIACALVAALALACITTGTAGGVIIGVWVGHPAAQAIAVEVCRIHMEPLMQPYAYVKNEVHNLEFHGFCIRLLPRALVAV